MLKVQNFNRNETDYEELRIEALKKHKKNADISFLLKDGLAAWTITSSIQHVSMPQSLSEMHISANIKQSELIHALTNIVIQH